jgi:hypothetical protein
MQDAQAQQTFLLEQVRKQAIDLGQATVAMPARVEQMSSTLSGLEGGEIKLRVRALEVERAARRASIMQVAPLPPLLSYAAALPGDCLHARGSAKLSQCFCHQTDYTCHCRVQDLAAPYMNMHT